MYDDRKHAVVDYLTAEVEDRLELLYVAEEKQDSVMVRVVCKEIAAFKAVIKLIQGEA